MSINKRKNCERLYQQLIQEMHVKYGFKERILLREIGFDNVKEITAKLAPDYFSELLSFEEISNKYLKCLPEEETLNFIKLVQIMTDVQRENKKMITSLQENMLVEKEDSLEKLQLFGDICLYCSHYENAENIYQFQIKHKITTGYNGMGLLHKNTGEYTHAKEYFTAGYEAGNKKAAYYLGCLHRELGQEQQARKWFGIAIIKNNDDDALMEVNLILEENIMHRKAKQLQKIAEKLTFKGEKLSTDEERIWCNSFFTNQERNEQE
ncbi:sel1 repeat family protein [Liquorilactobacillus capillatus]|nr:sel1 repeat family protein [Liquorilactobacillus capillatus]